MHSKYNDTSTHGFTIVEVIVTLAITTLFLTFFFQMFLTMEAQRIAVARQALASDIAFSNLRKFASRSTLTTLLCTSDMDLTTSGSKQGVLIGSDLDKDTPNTYGFKAEPNTATKKLGSGTHQEIRAFAPKGCSEPAYSNTPLKIESSVTFGSNNKVVHASYIN